jgi:pimeloyl-ACP methyl ester carboxylesterase
MGGAVTTLYAGTYPERVLGTVHIDNMGPYTTPAINFPLDLQKWVDGTVALHLNENQADVVGKNKKRPKPMYPSIEDAVTARSTGSRIPLTAAGARILCTRGLMSVTAPMSHAPPVSDEDPLKPINSKPMPASNGEKRLYTWRTDQRLTLTEMAINEDAALAFLQREGTEPHQKPVVFIIATRGYFYTQLFKDGTVPDATSRFWTRVKACRGKVVTYDGSHHLHLETRVEETAEIIARVIQGSCGKGYRHGMESLPGEVSLPKNVSDNAPNDFEARRRGTAKSKL